MDIPERLKLIRKKARLKQKEIAKLLGVTQGYVCDIERGAKKPSPMLRSLYCKTFNINSNWLETGEGSMFFNGCEKQPTHNESAVDIVGKLQAIDSLKANNSITESEFLLLKTNLLAPLKADT